jgi:hypothetical protein
MGLDAATGVSRPISGDPDRRRQLFGEQHVKVLDFRQELPCKRLGSRCARTIASLIIRSFGIEDMRMSIVNLAL